MIRRQQRLKPAERLQIALASTVDAHAMFGTLISRARLEDLAGTTVFERGEAYFDAGAVARLRITDDKIKANVTGSTTYRVALRNAGELDADCTCPYAGEGNLCKHAVALGLAWLSEQKPAKSSVKTLAKKRRRDPWQDIAQFLAVQSPETLIDLLLEVAQRDDRLYQSLLLKAERAQGGRGDIAAAFRHAIDDATHIHGFVDWREAASFAGDVDQLAQSMAELLQSDTAALLVELAEYAIERLEKAMEQVHDSDGEVGCLVADFGALHLKACRMARPEPAALAERLFALQTTLPFGLCSFDAMTYSGVLGANGLRRYRELAESEWHKLKPQTAQYRFDAKRFTLTPIMESLAKAAGDIDELVAIKSQNLSSAYAYLDIAQVWADAGQSDKALEWAERGLKAFAEHPDNRLRDFLVAIYLEAGRDDEAVQLAWIQFDERPSLDNYRKLHDVGNPLGRWPEQRERALARMAATAPAGRNQTIDGRFGTRGPDHSLRLQIALWEKDLATAWDVAHRGPCDRRLLIVLAGELQAQRPDDAISLYQQVVPVIVDQTNNAAYAEAIKLIRTIGDLMKANTQVAPFGDYLAQLRARFKLKRNFIKLLEKLAQGGGR